MRAARLLPFIPLLLTVAACAPRGGVSTGAAAAGAPFDVVIENGRVIDGTGAAWYYGDVAVRGDRIAAIGPRGAFRNARSAQCVDASGQVVAPGFIDIQSQSNDNFETGDGLALSMVTQGITTAILGEDETPAPANDKVLAATTDSAERARRERWRGPHGFAAWLEYMVGRGASQNIGSFVGGATVRMYGRGEAMGPATAVEVDTMQAMVRRVMQDGGFGVASALIYPPGAYAATDELIAINKPAAAYGGLYVTHLRSEGDKFLEALDEAIAVGRGAGVPVEVYHLKAAGVRNWPKMAQAIAKIDSARAAGQDVQANMYLYVAGANSLRSCIPPKYSADGKLMENLRNPAVRPTVVQEMHRPDASVELLCELATPAGVMVTGFKRPENRQFEGKRLSEIAAALNRDWADAVIDLTIAENAGPGEILFLMSEDNVKLGIRQPWMKFGTDAGSHDPATARGMTHPRAYGNFTRLLGKYVRDEQVVPLEEAVRKASSAVATRLSLSDRGVIKPGMKADLVVFDPNAVKDNATFEQPHQLSTGIRDVYVNGVAVLRNGRHTGAKPGQLVRGPGYTP